VTGNPLGTALIRRHGLGPRRASARELAAELALPDNYPARELRVEVEREDTPIVRNLVVLALAMGLGSLLSRSIQDAGFTLPAYIGAMIVASVLRNLDEATHWFRIDEDAVEFIGGFALNIFLVVALMDLKVWQLANQALPLFVILLAQLVTLLLLAWMVSFRLMGRDYDSAVMASGFIGFAMGTTANAVANMRSLVARFGPAPRAFLVIPLVGAFFIDFANALIVTSFVNWLK
jgi:ESS family glutamate:Na+ symporter